ncbi:hypothetical protein WJX74_000879 [Apatococcus lobatus]|uniref:Uncharacterized protein n=1 Tax=Apatococcus lobatus TaxID=904363 RepID=A0AAW1QWL0_9CHLO
MAAADNWQMYLDAAVAEVPTNPKAKYTPGQATAMDKFGICPGLMMNGKENQPVINTKFNEAKAEMPAFRHTHNSDWPVPGVAEDMLDRVDMLHIINDNMPAN